jgi:hypothetical protein
VNIMSIRFDRPQIISIAVYIAIAVGALVWGLSFLVMAAELYADNAEKSLLLDRLNQRSASLGSLADGNIAAATANAAIPAPTETVAAGVLQEYMLRQLDKAGGEVKSVQSQPSRNILAGGLHRISAELAFDATITSLQMLLFSLETDSPYVFVDGLSMQPTEESENGARPTGNGATRLRATLVVSSYWKDTQQEAPEK